MKFQDIYEGGGHSSSYNTEVGVASKVSVEDVNVEHTCMLKS